MAALVLREVKTREEVMGYFKTLFRGKLERTPSYLWTGLVDCCFDLYPEEVLEDIRQAFADGLVDSRSIGYETVTEQLMRSKTKVLRDVKEDHHYHLMGNTIEETQWWYHITSNEFFERFEKGELGDSEDYFEWSAIVQMHRRSTERLAMLEGEAA